MLKPFLLKVLSTWAVNSANLPATFVGIIVRLLVASSSNCATVSVYNNVGVSAQA